jgi:hypothetical protein
LLHLLKICQTLESGIRNKSEEISSALENGQIVVTAIFFSLFQQKSHSVMKSRVNLIFSTLIERAIFILQNSWFTTVSLFSVTKRKVKDI